VLIGTSKNSRLEQRMPLLLLVRKGKNEIHDIKKNNVNIATSRCLIEPYIAPILNADIEMETSNGKINLYEL